MALTPLYRHVAGQIGGSPLTVEGTDAQTIDISVTPGGRNPNSVAIHPSDPTQLYLAINEQHVVVRIDLKTNKMYTVAGLYGTIATISGEGDGGLATAARLANPIKIAFDAAGNLYIYERNTVRIRKVDTGGTITAFFDAASEGYTEILTGCVTATYLWASGWDGGGPSSGKVTRITLAGASPTNVTGLSAYPLRSMCPGPGLAAEGVFFIDAPSPSRTEFLNATTLLASFQSVTDAYLSVFTDSAADRLYTLHNWTGSPILSWTPGTPVGGNYALTSYFAGTAWSDVGFLDGDPIVNIPPFDPNGTTAYIPPYDMAIDPAGQMYLCGLDYLWGFFQEYRGDPATVISTPTIIRSNRPGGGFDDTNASTELATAFAGSTEVAASGTRTTTSIPGFMAAGQNIFVGSSFSNEDYDDLELAPAVMPVITTSHVFPLQMDFQNRGGGDGFGFGIDAQRIHIVNANGDFLVERWEENPGVTVRDYGVIFILPCSESSGGTMQPTVFVAGLRDISTWAAAFVVANATNIKYSVHFATTNALLVSVVMTKAVNDTGIGSFTPVVGDIGAMPIYAVSSTQPTP